MNRVRYATDSVPCIKIRVDSHRRKTSLVFLSGLEVLPLMQDLSETLAGRNSIFELLGSTMCECLLRVLESWISLSAVGSEPIKVNHQVAETLFHGYRPS